MEVAVWGSLFYFCGSGDEPRTLHVLSRCSTIELRLHLRTAVCRVQTQTLPCCRQSEQKPAKTRRKGKETFQPNSCQKKTEWEEGEGKEEEEGGGGGG